MTFNLVTRDVPKSAQKNGEALDACLNEIKAACERHGVKVGLVAIGIMVDEGPTQRMESATTNRGYPPLQFELLRALADRIKEHAVLLSDAEEAPQA